MSARYHRRIGRAFIAIALTATAPASAANTWYVRSGAIGNGTSWANAFGNMQSALSAAGAGDQIWVAAGTYKPSQATNTSDPRSVTFQLKNGVAIYGGFPAAGNPGLGDREPATHLTTLSGDLNGDDAPNFTNNGDNCYHVLMGSSTDNTAVLDGFTITSGNSNGSFGDAGYGGGMYNFAGSPTIRNCIFTTNASGNSAGGVMDEEASSPTLTNCTFSNNVCKSASAATYGGAMLNNNGSSPTMTGCLFRDNSAVSGSSFSEAGAIGNFANSSPTISNCTFTNNSAQFAGGVLSYNNSVPTFSHCSFIGNAATGASNSGAGALYNYGSNSPVVDCSFIGNTATGDGSAGGAVFNQSCSPTFTRCTFYGNVAGNGGGIAQNEGSSVIVNCVFSGNASTRSDSGGGAIAFGSVTSPTVTNCVFSGNTATYVGGALFNSSTSAMVTNCAFVGNSATGTGGAIMSNFGSPSVVNCTFSGNSAPALYSQYTAPTYTNLVIWANVGFSQIAWYSAVPAITHSDVQAGFTATGNISTDPLFVGGPSSVWTTNASYDANTGQTTLTDAGAAWTANQWVGRYLNPSTMQTLQGYIVASTSTQVMVGGNFAALGTSGTPYQISDFHLRAGSPCIDTASNAAVPSVVTTDFDSHPRILNGTVDMGAYEFVPVMSGDFNRDGDVDSDDYKAFAACISGPAIPLKGRCEAEDLDRDGDVDQNDFGIFQRCYSGAGQPADPTCVN